MKRGAVRIIGLVAGVVLLAAGVWLATRAPAAPPSAAVSADPGSAKVAATAQVTPKAAHESRESVDAAAAAAQQAVLVHLRLSNEKAANADEIAQLQELELKLEKVIERSGTGELDGNEIGDGEYVVFTYGPDADKLFLAIEPLLRASKLAKGGFVLKRYGDADDENAQEIRVDL